MWKKKCWDFGRWEPQLWGSRRKEPGWVLSARQVLINLKVGLLRTANRELQIRKEKGRGEGGRKQKMASVEELQA